MTRMGLATLLWFSLLCSNVLGAELLVFTAEWCAPCKAFKADYAQDPTIVGPYVGATALFDIAQASDIAKKYGVKTVPAFFVVDGDVILRKQEGYDGAANLKKWLENNKRLKR